MPLQALAFTAGVIWVVTRPALDAPTVGLALISAAIPLCAHRLQRFAIPFAVGVLCTLCRACSLLPPPLPAAALASDVLVVGDIASLPDVQVGRTQFDLALRDASVAGVPSRLRLSWFHAQRAPSAAETWQLVVRLRAPRGFANPGGYDYEGELFRAGIGATGYVRESPQNRRLALRKYRYPVLAARAAIARHIERTLSDSPAAGVVAGLAVGASQGISIEQWRVFAATGTTHLIAISGLHVTMVAALAMLVAQVVWRSSYGCPSRMSLSDVTCLCGALAACAYAALAGFSVPTQRTLVMLLCALSATWLRRVQPPTNVLSLALIAVLLYDPHAVLTAGLWLSFTAVAAIMLCVGSFLERPRPLRVFLATQVAVSVALVPATAVLFGSVSLVAPAVNLFAIPLYSGLLVPGTLLAIALQPLGGCSEFVLRWTARLFEGTWPVFDWAASLPGALIHMPMPEPWQCVVLGTSAVILLSPLPGRLRAPAVLAILSLMVAHPARPTTSAFALTALDVGQGLAVVVRTGAHALLFDAGPAFRSGRSAGDLVVVPYLRAQGVRQLDMLVLSHPDNDHAGGAIAVEQAFPIVTVRQGGSSRTRLNAPSSTCADGEGWIWEGVRFEFLHPRASERWSDNNGSCVLAISAGGMRALLTGDIERDAEEYLLARGDLPRADIVTVPHHGSRSSSSAGFVGQVHAQLAIVSAGAANRWGFPDDSVVQRWCHEGAQVIGTAEWGAITIVVDAVTGLGPPRSERSEHRRYWHAPSPEAGAALCQGPHSASESAVYAPRTVKYHPPQFVTIYH